MTVAAMQCTRASYPDKRSGAAAKRAITRVYKANTSIYLCGLCDRYHVNVEVGRYPVSESWQELLQCVAQGMTNEEITSRTNYKTKRSIEWAIEEMKHRFYALNRTHLIAIAISLGIVDPSTFVPAIQEKHDSNRSA